MLRDLSLNCCWRRRTNWFHWFGLRAGLGFACSFFTAFGFSSPRRLTNLRRARLAVDVQYIIVVGGVLRDILKMCEQVVDTEIWDVMGCRKRARRRKTPNSMKFTCPGHGAHARIS